MIIRNERTVVHPSRKNGKVTKSQNHTYFPGKDVPNLVLNRKDPLWRISRKAARFSQQAEHRAMSVDVRLISTAYANCEAPLGVMGIRDI